MTTLDERIEAARKLEGYTPGPWYQGSHIPESASVWIGGRAKEGGGAVLPYLAKTMNWPANYSANATLIAAAPDLHRLALNLAAERERLLTALRLHKAWADSERTGPDYGGQSRDTHPDGERIWRQWWDNQLDLCDRAQTATDAALASETRA